MTSGKTLFLIFLAVAMQSSGAVAQTLQAAVLPQSRSVQVGQPATAFAVIVNPTNAAVANCSVALASPIPATFSYFQTNAANVIVGGRNVPATIPANTAQNFLIELVASSAVAPTDLRFGFTCNGISPAPEFPGVNTFLFSASTSPVPDILSIGAVLSNDGISNIPGVNAPGAIGLMTVAAVNLGADQQMTVEAVISSASTPAAVTICETNLSTGACISPPTTNQLSTRVARGTSASAYSAFITSNAAIPFDPANVRVVVRFKDAGGAIRGATSAALRTRDLISASTNGTGVWDNVRQRQQQSFGVLLPSETTATTRVAPLTLAKQQKLLLSDLTDQSIANALASSNQLRCLLLANGNDIVKTDLMLAMSGIALATTRDREIANQSSQRHLVGVAIPLSSAPTNCP